ncbi:MAG: AzlD domain-containing protein [Anaerolineaceae bacterium]|nr:AzlD domain-containing protein [Anaerolineaceae bacterium]
MNIWLIIILGGLLTFSIRLSFVYLLQHVEVPLWFKNSLRFVPPAVLSAIILPEISAPNGPIDISWRNPQLLAGIVAVLVAWRTKNVLLTIAVGIVALLIFQALLGL